MARIRYLYPDFFKDEDLASLPFEARLCFAGLWVIADKAGRLEYRPKRLKIEVFPYDNVEVEHLLDLLSKPKFGTNKPFISVYAINSEKYIQILNWNKYQHPHHTERDSVIPEMPIIPVNVLCNSNSNSNNNSNSNSILQNNLVQRNSLVTNQDKINIKINQLGVKQPLDNGYLTVKQPLYHDFETTIIKKWNDFCIQNPMISKILKMTEIRRKHLKQRFLDKDFTISFEKVLEIIPKSPFLMGKTQSEKKWIVNFDWLIVNDNNYVKIMEGKYNEILPEKSKSEILMENLKQQERIKNATE